ncbi:peptide chain release factor RF-3 [Candidatus Kinetoplastibacterium desouzaii TCC079E]|uniref:Peptide chain release factor 3 n=1 Tax=Candidatus Kinetoplastidibacterium desouzai TCC079E TaxID=1208919 RepID=M1L1B3_9PROT|nr:peptide chain release factor 3 [Candidatus Kinetoplastibacterium desouzaii]AGF46573.1 peptide chain release factor RF-3 [Candidatus Kinetoplastibacterium desouzaii TCC079E]
MDIYKEVKRRRTFAIISHPDAGKTTLTEKILLFAGAIQIAGSVKSRKASKYASSDWMEIEKQRGISVASSVMQIEYNDCIINLLDTPGHQDFSEDTYRVLTAVDAALMVIDAANGIEAQTIKLLEVCRARKTPIITFINKLDREVREPLDLLHEVEKHLEIDVIPFTWPIGMGKSFQGVFDLGTNKILSFKSGEDRYNIPRVLSGNTSDYSNKKTFEKLFKIIEQDITLIKEAIPNFNKESFLLGEQTPVFFGSAINNFGVQEILDALTNYFPPPSPTKTIQRQILPNETKFTGLVFKIQANMDPAHRDRIAFIRIHSGHFKRGMKLKISRTQKEIKTNNVVSFLSQKRDLVDEAFAGDIIGIPNHGVLQIGDVLTEGEYLEFTGLPCFAPEIFKSIEAKDPLKNKQLNTGLKQLSEEGAIQVFQLYKSNNLILGAVGQLQFEVVAHRLQYEYNADVNILPTNYITARWISSNNERTLNKFINSNNTNIAYDTIGNITFLAKSNAQLKISQELNPDISFHMIREHNEKISGTNHSK